MSKIYEALQQAHQEKKASGKNLEFIIPQNLLNRNQVDMGEEMLSLFKVIDNRLPEVRNRVLLFIGSRPGEGTSTVVREFARIAAERVGQKVLLVDADRFEGTQSKFYSVESQTSWSQAIEEPAEVERAIHRVGESSLFVSPASNSGSPTPELFNALRFEDFWANVKLNFDLVVIDSSPLALSPDALAIASKVDGVILVVEAEKTRWRTAKYVKEQIEGVGGSLLGVVFNKRHFYIPQSIYEHL